MNTRPNVRRVTSKAYRMPVIKYHLKEGAEPLSNVEPTDTMDDLLKYLEATPDICGAHAARAHNFICS
jgi:hypothetical protein